MEVITYCGGDCGPGDGGRGFLGLILLFIAAPMLIVMGICLFIMRTMDAYERIRGWWANQYAGDYIIGILLVGCAALVAFYYASAA